MGNWTLETISWDRFDGSKVDPEILRNIKAAALVERNAEDYGVYLGRVFSDDAVFMEAVNGWVAEEIQHGMATQPSPASAPATRCRSRPTDRCAAARPAR